MEKENIIVIGESTNVLRLKIFTKDGKETGDMLEFNLKDIELLDRLDRMWNENQKNRQWINNQLVIIGKKQDFQRKGFFMTNNERLKYDALRSFYKKQKDIYDMFLGERGVDKILYGRPLEWETMTEIEDIIAKQIGPKLNINMKNIEKEIKTKYNITNQEKGNVLKQDE